MSSVETQMCDENNSGDYELLAELGTRLEELKAKHDQVFEEWMMLEEEI